MTHISCLKELLNSVHFGAGDPLLPLGLQQLAVICNILLQELVLVGVVVDDVALVPLSHHARICCSNAASSDNAHCLVLHHIVAFLISAPSLSRLQFCEHAIAVLDEPIHGHNLCVKVPDWAFGDHGISTFLYPGAFQQTTHEGSRLHKSKITLQQALTTWST